MAVRPGKGRIFRGTTFTSAGTDRCPAISLASNGAARVTATQNRRLPCSFTIQVQKLPSTILILKLPFSRWTTLSDRQSMCTPLPHYHFVFCCIEKSTKDYDIGQKRICQHCFWNYKKFMHPA